MKCRQITKLVNRYVDKQLANEQEAEFKKHISQCEKCQQEFNKISMIIQSLNSVKNVGAPASFTENVMHSIISAGMSPGKASPLMENYTLIYRRLGFSMILTAALMLLSIYIPSNWITYQKNTVQEYSKVEFLKGRNINITDKLGDINFEINKVFRIITNSIERFKEV